MFVEAPSAPAGSVVAPGTRRAPPAFGRPHSGRSARCRCHGQRAAIEPVAAEIAAFAPATIANLGPGFDWLGCAVKGEGDTVVARPSTAEPCSVQIDKIEGEGGRLSLNAHKNCAGIAAIKALELMGRTTCGVTLSLKKGLPLGSGMGSSAASAAAGAMAVNLLFGSPLSKHELVIAGLAAESVVSGYHADNVAPALLGSFVLVRSYRPLELHRLDFPNDLWFVLVTPVFEAPTAKMRAALPKLVPMPKVINNCSMGAALVAAIVTGDPKLFGSSLNSDEIVEPVRGSLIPGFPAVKRAALDAGAYGCTIGGAGPTAVAIVPGPEVGKEVAVAMQAAFKEDGSLETANCQIVQLDKEGATMATVPGVSQSLDVDVAAGRL
ncbi:unnamed protein product [Ostreobium quekettii]|uniref:Homoserine kinase n=1 Tax=Ostreobium quekettii TaxID=121088 RepID=A0A8S1IJZ9_9CHLO|nr:unnamed protein product [Ostreobium quekettii]CAD7702807.1 unnamed protein product [Ostreobium quekettii]|eukprot:evm.model.scf_73.3 EVM.evm.TU.scf_73.3   scf_73:14626-19401(+)